MNPEHPVTSPPTTQELQIIWECSPFGIAFIGRDGYLTSCNLAFLRCFEPGELLRPGISEADLVALINAGRQEHIRTEIHHADLAAAYYIFPPTSANLRSRHLSETAARLRDPLASATGFAELLRTEDFDAATRSDLLKTLQDELESLENIINQELDVSHTGP